MLRNVDGITIDWFNGDCVFSDNLVSNKLKNIYSMSIYFMQHTPLEKLDKKHFVKGSCRPEQNGSTAVPQDINSLKHVALMETKIKKLCDLLSKVSWLLTLSLPSLIKK